MNKRFLLLLLFALVPVLVSAQPRTYNTTLYDTLNPGVQGSPWNYSALTGYAAPDGREYALLGGYTGTHIIDVTDKPIREVAFVEGAHSGWREMKTYGTYAYVVSEGGGGLQIIDLSKLPAKATLVREDKRYFNTAHTISQEGTYVYVNGTKADAGANGGTMIFNLATDPTNPVLLGKWTGRYVHDATVRNDTLYAAAINDGALDIVYLGKDRKNPTQVTEITYPGAGTHNSDLTADGRYILTTDEVHSTPKTLKVWDRNDIGAITKVADYTPAPGEIIHNVHIKGNLAVIAWYTAGTRIIDISDPVNPVEVGFFDEWSGPSGGFQGNWGVYPYLPSGKILASDMSNGLYVFTFNGAQQGSVSGVVRDAKTGSPIAGATITFPDLGRVVTSDASGRYSFTGGTDSLDYVATKSDYSARIGRLALTAGGNSYDILLTPMDNIQLMVLDNAAGTPLPNFAYRLVTRTESEGSIGGNPTTLRLSRDTTYSVEVAAWGYIPRTVDVNVTDGSAVTVRLEHGYVDDAELDLGWSLAGSKDDTTGRWGRGIPVENWIQTVKGKVQVSPTEDHTNGAGNHAFMTGIGGDSQHEDVNGAVTLTSPLFDLTNYNDPYLNFSTWFVTTHPIATGDDTLLVEVSNDGGKNWVTLTTVNATLTEWREDHIRVADVLTPTSSMYFRVVAQDVGRPSLVRAGLDDFSVSEGVPASTDDAARSDAAVVALYPNPVTGDGVVSLTLNHTVNQALLELYDLQGRRVVVLHDGAMQSGVHQILLNVRGLTAGSYTWRLSLDDGKTQTGRVIVVR